MKDFKVVLIIILLISINSCKQEDVDKRSSTTFIATYEHPGINSLTQLNPFTLSCAIETSTGELISVGTELSTQRELFIVVIKTDSKGNKLWTKRYKMLRRLDTNIWNLIQLSDGSLFINSRRTDEILRINVEGDIIYHTTFIDDWEGSLGLESISRPLIEEDGKLYLSARYHGGSNLPTANILASINDVGGTKTVQRFNEDSVGTIHYHNVVKVDGDTAFYISSIPIKTELTVGGWLGVRQPSLSKKPILYDIWYLTPLEDEEENISIVPNNTFSGPHRDGAEFTCLFDANIGLQLYQNSTNPIRFSRVNFDNGKHEIKTYSNANYAYTANSFIKSKDGGYFICGIVNKGLPSEGSFLIKLNGSLEIVFEKYDFDKSWRFNQISECKDGSLLICGYVNGMGQGDDTKYKRYLLCRLNSDGTL